MKNSSQPNRFELREEGAGNQEFRSQTAQFYDGIAGTYDFLMGSHVAATATDLRELLQTLGRNRFSRVFEIGCGPGVLSAHLLKIADYCHAIDVAPEMVEIARRNLAWADPATWMVDEADIFCLPTHLRRQRFKVVFFWGNGMTHIPPPRYEEFAAAVDEILAENGLLIINVRDGKEWVALAGKLDLVSRFNGGANFVHIYKPVSPQVGDLFECVIVKVNCSADGEISGQIVSPTVQAYFNDCDALVERLAEKGFGIIHNLPATGLSTARTFVFQRGKR